MACFLSVGPMEYDIVLHAHANNMYMQITNSKLYIVATISVPVMHAKHMLL